METYILKLRNKRGKNLH